MTDYHLRCAAADVPLLLDLAVLLGVLRVDAETGVHVPADPSTVWDVIGTVHKPTGMGDETAPVLDANGQPYWHANLRIDGSLLDLADAIGGPEIAAALANLSRWFVADAAGQPVAPQRPVRVFA